MPGSKLGYAREPVRIWGGCKPKLNRTVLATQCGKHIIIASVHSDSLVLTKAPEKAGGRVAPSITQMGIGDNVRLKGEQSLTHRR